MRRDVLVNKGLTISRWSDTLGKFVAEREGESGPVWAQHQFSFRFTGLPPLEAYEYQHTMELIEDDFRMGGS